MQTIPYTTGDPFHEYARRSLLPTLHEGHTLHRTFSGDNVHVCVVERFEIVNGRRLAKCSVEKWPARPLFLCMEAVLRPEEQEAWTGVHVANLAPTEASA